MLPIFQPQFPIPRSTYPVGEIGLKAYEADVKKYVDEQFKLFSDSLRSQLEMHLRLQKAHADSYVEWTKNTTRAFEAASITYMTVGQ